VAISLGGIMYYVYILTNKNNHVIYTGVTNDLQRRVAEHKTHLKQGFTNKYNVTKLVYYEITSSVISAIEREKQIKSWSRIKKNRLVQSMNPVWTELSI